MSRSVAHIGGRGAMICRRAFVTVLCACRWCRILAARVRNRELFWKLLFLFQVVVERAAASSYPRFHDR